MVLALVSHNTLIEKIWKYVECLNGISIGISQYIHRENMENVECECISIGISQFIEKIWVECLKHWYLTIHS